MPKRVDGGVPRILIGDGEIVGIPGIERRVEQLYEASFRQMNRGQKIVPDRDALPANGGVHAVCGFAEHNARSDVDIRRPWTIPKILLPLHGRSIVQ